MQHPYSQSLLKYFSVAIFLATIMHLIGTGGIIKFSEQALNYRQSWMTNKNNSIHKKIIII